MLVGAYVDAMVYGLVGSSMYAMFGICAGQLAGSNSRIQKTYSSISSGDNLPNCLSISDLRCSASKESSDF